MGGKISFAICVVATILLYNRQPLILFWIAIATAIVNFWSWGIMHNFFIASKGKIDAVPNWISLVNMGSTFVGAVLLVYALVIIFSG